MSSEKVLKTENKLKVEKKAKTPKRLGPSIRHDPCNPTDYLKYNLPWSCQDCCHFAELNKSCSLGYETQWHQQEYQKKSYELSGKFALCRFQEID